MALHSNIDGEESATVTFSVGTISLTRNSSVELQEILCLGDPEVASSLGLARVLASAPASTAAALIVRIAGGPSSVVDFAVRAVLQSTATDNPVTFTSTHSVQAKNSTIGDLLASVQQNSTVWAVQIPSSQSVQVKNSTIGDLLASVQQNSTVWQVQLPSSQSFQVKNSTIGDLLASVQQNSTVWVTQPRLFTSSGGGVEGSTTTPSTGAVLGLNVRDVMPSGRQSTTTLITSTHSTAVYSMISSVAGLNHKVKAYFVSSTHTNPSTLIFMSSLVDRWHVGFGSGSSGITGANMGIPAPDFIFETVAANALNCRIEGGSSVTATVVARVSLSWFTEA